MKNLKYIVFFLFALFASCEDVVDADLNTAPPKLVIDASIDWEKGTDGAIQTIKLTTTTGFYADEIPVVSGASIQIESGGGGIFNFPEIAGTGNYVCTDFVPEIGQTYTLTVVVDGQTYTAVETLVGVPEIAYIEQDETAGFDGDLYEIKFFFQDDGAANNHYMTAFETESLAYPDYDVFDDEFTQGNLAFGLFLSEDVRPGDQMELSLYGISERFEDYMFTLLNISDGGNGPWQSPPTNVRGNIVNQTDFDNFALGFFRLSEVDRTMYIVAEPD